MAMLSAGRGGGPPGGRAFGEGPCLLEQFGDRLRP